MFKAIKNKNGEDAMLIEPGTIIKIPKNGKFILVEADIQHCQFEYDDALASTTLSELK